MMKSRDITLVILLAVVSFVYTVFVGQLGNLLTGIQGLNYLVIIGHMIFISYGFLMYEGRRWRLFSAKPFEKTIELLIEIKTEQAQIIQESKQELLSSWQKMTKDRYKEKTPAEKLL